MALQTNTMPVPGHVPSAEDLRHFGAETLVLFPDTVSLVQGELVAGFRGGSQELRVHAKRAGLDVELVVPEGAKPGQYSEHDADWVLPLILSVSTGVVSSLIATRVQAWIDQSSERGWSRMPTVRVREVIVDDETSKVEVREVEGPADEIVGWLLEREGTQGEADAARGAEDDWNWPAPK
jgi:hypothetical protein